jgi:hypothetical protein
MMMERDIKPLMNAYASLWGRYPWPAPFADGTYANPGCNSNVTCATTDTRTQNQYVGNTTLTAGLMPMTTTAAYGWNIGTFAISVLGGTGNVPAGLTICSSAGATLTCNFAVVGIGLGLIVSNLRLRFEGQANNVGTSFATVSATLNECSALGVNCVTPVTLSSTGLTSTPITSANNGTGTVAFEGTYNNCTILCARFMQMTLTIAPSTLTSRDYSINPSAAWFTADEWWRHTYYAVSSGYLPGGTGTCNTTGVAPVCLTVNNVTGTTNNKLAVLVLAGRSLNGTSRPSSALANYFEGENQTPADAVFVHRAGSATSINDRVVAVAP